jgi:hypothetical protein
MRLGGDISSMPSRQFVEDLPAIETRRHLLKRELYELADTRRRAEQGVDEERREKTRRQEQTR